MAIALVCWVGAGGTAGAAESAAVSVVLYEDGSGSMVANSQTNPPDETWHWEVCSPSLSSCQSFGEGRSIVTAGAMAESVFRASSSLGATALSPVWHGNLTPATPPSVSGPLRANAFLVPTSGQWNGGWDGDAGFIQLAACPHRSSLGCTPFTDPEYVPDYGNACEERGAVLDPLFTGQYLRVAEREHGPHPISLLLPVWPFIAEPWPVGPLTSVAFVGRIKPATGPRTETCGTPPLVEASISVRGVAKVNCILDCRAVLLARGPSGTARVSRQLKPAPMLFSRPVPPTILRLDKAQLARLGPGPIRMQMRVGGKVYGQRTVPWRRFKAGPAPGAGG